MSPRLRRPSDGRMHHGHGRGCGVHRRLPDLPAGGGRLEGPLSDELRRPRPGAGPPRLRVRHADVRRPHRIRHDRPQLPRDGHRRARLRRARRRGHLRAGRLLRPRARADDLPLRQPRRPPARPGTVHDLRAPAEGDRVTARRPCRRRTAARLDRFERQLHVAAPPLHVAGRQPRGRAVRRPVPRGRERWLEQAAWPTEPYARDIAISATPFRGRALLPWDEAERTRDVRPRDAQDLPEARVGRDVADARRRGPALRPDGSVAVHDAWSLPPSRQGLGRGVSLLSGQPQRRSAVAARGQAHEAASARCRSESWRGRVRCGTARRTGSPKP